MKCSICGRDASYMKSIDKKIVNRILQYGSELFAARCRDCLYKEETKE